MKSFKLVLKSFDVHKTIMPKESYMANVNNMKFINLIYNFNSVMTDDKNLRHQRVKVTTKTLE